MSIECVLTDPLFYGVAIAGFVLGASLAVFFVMIAAGNKDKFSVIEDDEYQTISSPNGRSLIVCTKEELSDPDFLDRIYKAHRGA